MKKYMINTLQEDGDKLVLFYNGVKAVCSKRKGALMKPEKKAYVWGLTHEMPYVNPPDKYPIWAVFEYLAEEAVVLNNKAIGVPRAWLVAWGTAQEMQKLFGELTGKPYIYDYAVGAQLGFQTKLRGGSCSLLQGGDGSTVEAKNISVVKGGKDSMLKAGRESVARGSWNSSIQVGDYSYAVGGSGSKLTGGNECILAAGNKSELNAGILSILKAGNESVLKGADSSIFIAGTNSKLVGGAGSVFITHSGSFIKARDVSILIVKGEKASCQCDGVVLVVFVVYDNNRQTHIFLTKVVNGGRHHFKVVKKKEEWILEDIVE